MGMQSPTANQRTRNANERSQRDAKAEAQRKYDYGPKGKYGGGGRETVGGEPGDNSISTDDAYDLGNTNVTTRQDTTGGPKMDADGNVTGGGMGGGSDGPQDWTQTTDAETSTTETQDSTSTQESSSTTTDTSSITGGSTTSGESLTEWIPSEEPQPFREAGKYKGPEWDDEKLKAKQQAFASPMVRRLRDQVQRAQTAASHHDNPNVVSDRVRQALAGYGQGLEGAMSTAFGQAFDDYNAEFGREVEEKRINFDAAEKNKDMNFNAAMNAWLKKGKQKTSSKQDTQTWQDTQRTSQTDSTSKTDSSSTRQSDTTSKTDTNKTYLDNAGSDGAGGSGGGSGGQLTTGKDGSKYAGMSLKEALSVGQSRYGKKSGGLHDQEMSNWKARRDVYVSFGYTPEQIDLRDPRPRASTSKSGRELGY